MSQSRGKVLIIGAGIAGLSAGVYAQQCGFDATILEQHTIPGGNCTSWRRGGYLFEGGMHWLTGSDSVQPLYRVWRTVGGLNDESDVTYHQHYFIIEHEGIQVGFDRDLERFRAHLMHISPQDESAIDALIREITQFKVFIMPVTDIKGLKAATKARMGIGDMLSMLPALPKMRAYQKITARDYAERFKSPAIRAFLSYCLNPETPIAYVLVTFGQFASYDGGYLEGGSLQLARNIADRFEALGGQIVYGTSVERILVEDGRARGVVADGREWLADAVIVTSDTLVAIDHLFDEPPADTWIEVMRRETKGNLFCCTFVCLGIEADLRDVPHSIRYPLDEPFEYADIAVDDINFYQYADHPTYAPPGCTAMTSVLMGDTYDWWQARKADGTYESEKAQVGERLLALLEKKLPAIAGKATMLDVATPLTYERYCGTLHGGWMNNMPVDAKMTAYPQTTDAIAGLYFAGQRIMPPGGLPVAVYTGRGAVQHLCRDTDTVFVGEGKLS